MKKKTNEQEFYSIGEYEKKYYPQSYGRKTKESEEKINLGIIMARESLSKFKQLIQKQKVCL